MWTNTCFWEDWYFPLSFLSCQGRHHPPSHPHGLCLPRNSKKSKKPPKCLQTPDISPRFLMIASVTGTRREGSHLEKKQFFLCREMFTCELRGWMHLQCSSFNLTLLLKKWRNFFFFPRSVLKLLSLLLFLLFVFIAFFLHPSVHNVV